MNTGKIIHSIDFLLIIAVIALSVFGIIIIGSAVHINTDGLEGSFTNQVLWLSTGAVLMILAAGIDYKIIGKLYLVLYAVNIILLVLVLLIGKEEANVKRWLFGIQPSEFSKIFMIIYLAKYIDKTQEKVNNISILFVLFISTAIPFVLIKEEPSLSAGLVLIAILVTELFVGGLNVKYIIIAFAVMLFVGIVVYCDLKTDEHKILKLFLEDYHIKRLLTQLNPDPSSPDYYQTKNSIWAIGAGKLTGKGLYNGTINQLSYLPYSHNDFIFSVVGEEFGFIGCLGVLLTMLFIISRCIVAAYRAEDGFGQLIASGVAGMFAFQTFTNVGVATGLLPNTGMPFPFLSYGGSSMWINMIATGLVINVGLNRKKSMF
jgi:rod shape determining protein RodA